MSFLAPAFFIGLAAIAVPILIHLIQRERKVVVHFPSLMFLRKIPYQSVQRRKIHNWLLLLLRTAVILLDRSASMGYGDRWDRAREAATKVVGSLSANDKGTLVLFGTGEEETVR